MHLSRTNFPAYAAQELLPLLCELAILMITQCVSFEDSASILGPT
jgi:hypothetical protein